MRKSPIVVPFLIAGSLTLGAMPLALRGQEMPQPTPEHDFVQESVGEWEGTMTNQMPGAPADGIPARQTAVPIGRFWIQTTFESEMMGMPYVGTGALGYDPKKKKYVGTWIDSYSSFMALMEGEKREDGTLIMRWTGPDMTGAMVPHRYEMVRKGSSEITTFHTGEGEGTKTMTIALRRTGKVREAGAGK